MAELFGSEDESVSKDLKDKGLEGKQISKAVSMNKRKNCPSKWNYLQRLMMRLLLSTITDYI